MRRRLGFLRGREDRDPHGRERVPRAPRTGLATGSFVLAALVIVLALGFGPTVVRSGDNVRPATASGFDAASALAPQSAPGTEATPTAADQGGNLPSIKPTPTITNTRVNSGTKTPTNTPEPTATPHGLTPTATPAAGHFYCPGNSLAGCPFQLTPTGNLAIDNVWYGQMPTDPSTMSKPVLLFIHGDADIAEAWWTDVTELSQNGPNDMYLLAYNAGYRTAFVQLQTNGSTGPDYNSWVNDQILAQQIQAVAQYYGVSTMDVITHSKGGLDLEAAMALEKDSNGRPIGSYVNTVIELSAPNQGSALAGLVCTPSAVNPPVFSGTMTVTPTATVPIDGAQPVCDMTPYYMVKSFRPTVDPALVQFLAPATGTPVSFFWLAGGTDEGPPGSALNTAGQELSKLDPKDANDGFVPVLSATTLNATPTLNNARYLFVRVVNHDSIRIGHNSWPWIQMLLNQATPAPTSAAYTPQPTFAAARSSANQSQPKR